MQITAAMVKELRERTGAAMMDCKKALTETQGDMEAAIAELRKRGEAKAAKRAGHIAAEGVIEIAAAADNRSVFMVEVNSETDFVARDENFSGFVKAITGAGLSQGAKSAEELLAVSLEGQTIDARRQQLISKIGENINIRRACLLSSEGVVGAYQHGTRIGVLVALDQNDVELAKGIAMHIAAINPLSIDSSSIAPAVLQSEREIYRAQAEESGKSGEIVDKMVEGRVNKFLKENCLLDQTFVKDPNQTVGALLKAKNAKVLSFVRFEVGEGIEKKTVDFAEEVKAQVQGS